MYNSNNPFAKIITGEIEATKVYEDEKVIAFNDISPVAPVHILVVPKAQYVDYSDFIDNAPREEILHFFLTVNDIIATLDLEEGYRIVTNKGAQAGQSVFHFHVHVIGGRKLAEVA